MLGSLACVDIVTVFDEDTPIEAIRAVVPDVLVKGSDYTRETVVGHEFVEAAGGRVFLADLKAGFSTTGTVRKLGEQPAPPA